MKNIVMIALALLGLGLVADPAMADPAAAAAAVSGLSAKVSRGVKDWLLQIVADKNGLANLRFKVSGEEAFLLYDTYGFPLDLTQEIASEHGMEVDLGGFNKAMELQRGRGRASGRFDGSSNERNTYESLGVGPSEFKGYDNLILSLIHI